MTSIVYTSAKSKKKKAKAGARERELKAGWEALLKKHATPLERGGKSNGVQAKAARKASVQVLDTTPPKDSYSGMKGVAALKPVDRYTGDKCIGVALMHKSNYTPVFQAEDAVAIAKMRR